VTSAEKPKKSRRAWLLRGLVFLVIVAGCAFSSKAVRRKLSSFRQNTCAEGSASPPPIDEALFPVRVGPQENLCAEVPDGLCVREGKDFVVRGECESGRMEGLFTVNDAPSGDLLWSGTYENGWPRGDFKVRAQKDHLDTFRVENLHLDGPSTKWEREGERWLLVSGRYERGRKVGRFTKRLENGPVRSALVFDQEGLASKEFFYCTNGNLKEVKGRNVIVEDAKGNRLAETNDDAALCPLP